MDRMSKEAEEQILRAVEAVSTAVAGGALPTDAIVKIAEDSQISAGHAQLMARAYNVSCANAHRRSASDPIEKAAAILLADPEEVFQRLTPQVKAASAIHRETAVSPEYKEGPWWLEKAAHNPYRPGAAIHVKIGEPAPRNLDPAKEAYAKAEKRAKHVENLRRDLEGRKHELARGLDKLAEWFMSNRHVSFETCRKHAHQRFGKVADLLMGRVESVRPGISKQASVSGVWQRFDPDVEPFTIINQLTKLAESLPDLIDQHKQASDQHFNQCVDEVLPHCGYQSLLHGLLPHRDVYKEAAALTMPQYMSVSLARDAIGSMARGMKSPDRESLINGQLSAISSPEHEQTLRDIQTQSMLQGLLTEENIGGHDPFAVTDSYNNLSEMAPRTAMHPMAVQAILRKQLAQGATDPFEVEQILKTEKGFKDVQDLPGEMPKNVSPNLFA